MDGTGPIFAGTYFFIRPNWRNQAICRVVKIDDLVKSLKRRIAVIPAKAGIQLFQMLKNSLDSGFHRSDDFLREHQD